MNVSIETAIRSRKIRAALALAMASLGLWAFAPYLTAEIGGEAYVDAPLIRIATPVAGLVTADLPRPGTPIPRATAITMVEALADGGGPLAELRGRRSALAAARDLAGRQLAEIRSADGRLGLRSRQYGTAATARLAATTRAAIADLAACRQEAAEAALQRDRIDTLIERRFATFAQRDRAHAQAASLAARCDALDNRAQALRIETGAAGGRLFLAGAAMDASYADQQRDRLFLRRQELEMIVADADARLAELDRQIAAEQRRADRLAHFRADLPAGTVVWSQPASRGTVVAAGANIIDLVDCGRRFVVVPLPERRLEAVLPGSRVEVRLVGSNRWEAGVVKALAGAAARSDGAITAARMTHEKESLTVEVALAAPASLARRCDVGRLAEVRFPRW